MAEYGKAMCSALKAVPCLSEALCSYKAISTNTAPKWFLIKHKKNIFEKCAHRFPRSSVSLLSRNPMGTARPRNGVSWDIDQRCHPRGRGLPSLQVSQIDGAPCTLHILGPGSPSSCRKHLLEDVDGQIHSIQGVEGRRLWAEDQRRGCFTGGVILQQLDLNALHTGCWSWSWHTSTGHH